MKCVITQEETDVMSKGVPLSREGRELLKQVHENHNKRIKDEFVKRVLEQNDKMPEEFAASLAPKISKNKVLGLIKKREYDIMETLRMLMEKTDVDETK